MNQEAKLLQQAIFKNRGSYISRISQAQKKRDRTQEHTGIILDYDPSSGNYTVENESGQTVMARAISNSSAICLGSSVSLVIPFGGTPIIDAMPI